MRKSAGGVPFLEAMLVGKLDSYCQECPKELPNIPIVFLQIRTLQAALWTVL